MVKPVKPLSGKIKLVPCCWLDGAHISRQKNTRAGGYRQTTRNTCGRRMETVTHLQLFVAIDTRVYPFKWEHHPAAAGTGLLLNQSRIQTLLIQIQQFFYVFLMPNGSCSPMEWGLKNKMQQASRKGKTNIIKTRTSSSLPNVVPDMLTTWRPCEPAARLKLCWPVNTAALNRAVQTGWEGCSGEWALWYFDQSMSQTFH